MFTRRRLPEAFKETFEKTASKTGLKKVMRVILMSIDEPWVIGLPAPKRKDLRPNRASHQAPLVPSARWRTYAWA